MCWPLTCVCTCPIVISSMSKNICQTRPTLREIICLNTFTWPMLNQTNHIQVVAGVVFRLQLCCRDCERLRGMHNQSFEALCFSWVVWCRSRRRTPGGWTSIQPSHITMMALRLPCSRLNLCFSSYKGFGWSFLGGRCCGARPQPRSWERRGLNLSILIILITCHNLSSEPLWCVFSWNQWCRNGGRMSMVTMPRPNNAKESRNQVYDSKPPHGFQPLFGLTLYPLLSALVLPSANLPMKQRLIIPYSRVNYFADWADRTGSSNWDMTTRQPCTRSLNLTRVQAWCPRPYLGNQQ